MSWLSRSVVLCAVVAADMAQSFKLDGVGPAAAQLAAGCDVAEAVSAQTGDAAAVSAVFDRLVAGSAPPCQLLIVLRGVAAGASLVAAVRGAEAVPLLQERAVGWFSSAAVPGVFGMPVPAGTVDLLAGYVFRVAAQTVDPVPQQPGRVVQHLLVADPAVLAQRALCASVSWRLVGVAAALCAQFAGMLLSGMLRLVRAGL